MTNKLRHKIIAQKHEVLIWDDYGVFSPIRLEQFVIEVIRPFEVGRQHGVYVSPELLLRAFAAHWMHMYNGLN